MNQGDNGNGEDWYIIYDENGSIIGITTGYDPTINTATNIANKRDYEYVDIKQSITSEHAEQRIQLIDQYGYHISALYNWELDRTMWYPFVEGHCKMDWVKVPEPVTPIDHGAVDWGGIGRGFAGGISVGVGVPMALVGGCLTVAGLGNPLSMATGGYVTYSGYDLAAGGLEYVSKGEVTLPRIDAYTRQMIFKGMINPSYIFEFLR